MRFRFLKEMTAVIRAENKRREPLLPGENPEFAYDQWVSTDAPFISELCLALLVALSHQIDRELIGLAARADDDGKEISRQRYGLTGSERNRVNPHSVVHWAWTGWDIQRWKIREF